ncbi:MAG: hypothetical protein JST26_12985 [Bacteroidetes bacterium]|nr:hypothetical protein [Bacteroidota bacterium]
MKTKNEKQLPTTKTGWMAFIYKSCSNGIRAAKSNAPREWLAKKGLSIDATGACFNSGQMHHRQEQSFKMALAEVGFMQKSTVGVNSDTVPYTVFGIFSIMFPLRNESNEIVNFYSIRIRSENTAYMNQEPGLYPGYPSELTKRLFVVNTVLEAATILESKVLDNKEAVIALHEGKVMPEHERAIKRLTALVEVIYIDTPLVKPKKENKVWDKNGVKYH